ncbi:MAG: hypothetical protein IPK85_07570 [Gemmatimonadetes bacterium]|nr:hypothetical protein [Gemmatimonadota bacterium]
MTAPKAISQDRAGKVARGHACAHCLEYSFKKVSVKRAPTTHKKDLKTHWIVTRVCGVCGLDQELGIDSEGEIVYGG